MFLIKNKIKVLLESGIGIDCVRRTLR